MIVRPVPLGAAFAVPNMSHYREKLLEHVFISEVLQECFLVRGNHVEVLHAATD